MQILTSARAFILKLLLKLNSKVFHEGKFKLLVKTEGFHNLTSWILQKHVQEFYYFILFRGIDRLDWVFL